MRRVVTGKTTGTDFNATDFCVCPRILGSARLRRRWPTIENYLFYAQLWRKRAPNNLREYRTVVFAQSCLNIINIHRRQNGRRNADILRRFRVERCKVLINLHLSVPGFNG